MFDTFNIGKFKILHAKSIKNLYIYLSAELSENPNDLFIPRSCAMINLEDIVALPGQKLSKNKFDISTSVEFLNGEKPEVITFERKNDKFIISSYVQTSGKTKVHSTQEIDVDVLVSFLKEKYKILIDEVEFERSMIDRNKNDESMKEFKKLSKYIEKMEKFVKK